MLRFGLPRSRQKVGLALVRTGGIDFQDNNGKPVRCHLDYGSSQDKDTILSHSIPKAKQWIVVLPTYHCGFRHLTLPTCNPQEMEKMLVFEVSHHLPCTVTEWVWDYYILSHEEGGSIRLLLIFTPLEVIKPVLDRLAGLGIQPDTVLPQMLYHAFMLPLNGKDQNGNGTVFWMTEESLECMVLKDTRVESFRGIALDKHMDEGAAFLHDEISRSKYLLGINGDPTDQWTTHVVYANEECPDVTRMVQQVWGGTIESTELDPTKQHIRIKRLFRRFSLNRSSGNDGPSAINLLPKALKDQRKQRQGRKQLVGIACRVVFIFVLAFYGLKTGTWRQDRILKRYQQRINTIGPQAKKLEGLQKQLDGIRNQVQGHIPTLDIIAEFYKHLPEDVTIHYLCIEKGAKVTMRAQSRLLSQAFDCIGPLEESLHFVNVRQSYANQRQVEDNILIDFEIVAKLHKPNL